MGPSLLVIVLSLLLYFCKEAEFTISLIMLISFALSREKTVRSLLLHFLLALLISITFSHSLNSSIYSAGFDDKRITRVAGKVSFDSADGKFNSSSVTIELSECGVASGAAASSRGKLTVYYPGKQRLYAGDIVSFEGKIKANYFSANKLTLIERKRANKARLVILTKLSKRLQTGFREADELSSMLLLGISSDPEFELKQLAQKSGTSYVLALSGMHISLLSLLLLAAFKPVLGKRGGKLVSLIIILIYVFLIGPKPSLLRAVILSLCFFVRSKRSGGENLFLTFLIQLALFPSNTQSLSSVLSYISLSGILGFSGLIKRRLDSLLLLPNALASSLSASLSAQLFIAPFSLVVFGYYQLSSIFTAFIISTFIYLYMLLSIFSLALPVGKPRLYIYKLIKQTMLLGSKAKAQETIIPYLVMCSLLLLLFILSYILSERRNTCGISIMTVQKR